LNERSRIAIAPYFLEPSVCGTNNVKTSRSKPEEKIVGLFKAEPQEKQLVELLDRAIDKAIQKGLRQQERQG
jgi:hypothetical protein